MSHLDNLDFIFSPLIEADKNPFTIEQVVTKKISGEVITDKDIFTVELFDLDIPIIEKIIQLSQNYTFKIGKYNIISKILFIFNKSRLLKQLDLTTDQFYMISKSTDTKLKRFGIHLNPKKYIDIDEVVIIGSCQQLVITKNQKQIWFDKGKFKTIKLS
jgi:hypothetical protein